MVRTRKQRQTAPGTPEAAPQEEDAAPVADVDDVDETKKKQRRRSSGLGSWLNTSTLATLAAAFYVVTAVRNFGRAARARDIGRRATRDASGGRRPARSTGRSAGSPPPAGWLVRRALAAPPRPTVGYSAATRAVESARAELECLQPRRGPVAAPPRPPAGYSVASARGAAAATT